MKQFSDTMICLSGITLRLFEDDFRDLHSEAWHWQFWGACRHGDMICEYYSILCKNNQQHG
jgi:hypothetical protein